MGTGVNFADFGELCLLLSQQCVDLCLSIVRTTKVLAVVSQPRDNFMPATP